MKHDSRHLFVSALAFVLVCTAACSDSTGPAPATHIQNLIPENGATDVPALITLHWSSPDVVADSITYDVYLGGTHNAPKVASGITDTVFTTQPLDGDETYYWRVIARTPQGVVGSSSIWEFTTTTAFIFPLALGNRWHYESRQYGVNFEPDSIGAQFGDTIFATSVSTVTGPFTLDDSLHGLVVANVHTRGLDVYTGLKYMSNTGTGLYTYAYTGGRVDPPKALPQNAHVEFHGIRFDDIESLTRALKGDEGWFGPTSAADPIREDPPVRELAYPLQMGREWIYRTPPWKIAKEVTGRSAISTPAGTFDCYDIRWRWDFENDGQWETDIVGFDYLSRVGYVKRFFEIYGFVIVDEEAHVLGTYDWHEEYVLMPNP